MGKWRPARLVRLVFVVFFEAPILFFQKFLILLQNQVLAIRVQKELNGNFSVSVTPQFTLVFYNHIATYTHAKLAALQLMARLPTRKE
jgi:hypothetical protein